MEDNYNFNFDPEQCWYKDACKYYGTEDCNQLCRRYTEMSFLMKSSLIPKPLQKQNNIFIDDDDREAYAKLTEIKKNIREYVEQGKNIYLYSHNFGNGKTTWGIKLLQNYFNSIWDGNGCTTRGIFIHVPTFLLQYRENLQNPTLEFLQLKKDVFNVDLVVWDDIGSQFLTKADYGVLLTYIDNRILNLKSNIYTSNLDSDELNEVLGSRAFSRIWNNSIQIEFKGNDKRGVLKDGSITDIK